MDFDTIELNEFGYNISTLVDEFYAIQRYDIRKFRPTNHVLLSSDDYLKQLAAYAVMAIIFSILITILILIWCGCSCWCASINRKSRIRNQGVRDDRKFYLNLSKIIVVCLTIITMLTYTFGFIGIDRLGDYGSNSCGDIEALANDFHDVSDMTNKTIHNVDQLFDRIDNSFEKFDRQINELPPTDKTMEIKRQLNEIKENYHENIKWKVDHTMNDIKKQFNSNNGGTLEKISNQLSTITNNCNNKVDNNRKYMLIVMIISTVFTSIFIVGTFCRCFTGCSCCLAFVFIQNLLTYGAILFIMLVIGSDFCKTSKLLAKDWHKNSNPFMDSSFKNDLNYYLFCPINNQSNSNNDAMGFNDDIFDNGGIRRIFAETHRSMNQVRSELESVKVKLDNVYHECIDDGNNDNIKAICEEIFEFNVFVYTNVTQTSYTVDSIVEKIDCPTITPMINEFLTNFCTNLYDSIFLFFLNSITTFIGYFILILITISLVMGVI